MFYVCVQYEIKRLPFMTMPTLVMSKGFLKYLAHLFPIHPFFLGGREIMHWEQMG